MNIRALNHAILLLAPAFVARDHAPATFAELVQCRATLLHVRADASEATIYQSAHVNHAFRAWHDSCHIAGQFPFTLEGERTACELQITQLLAVFPSAPAWALGLIRAEVIGQAEYFARTGAFPANQAAFIAAYLKGTGK